MKKEFVVPLAVVGLTIAFGVVCALVYFSRGKKFISWKMKIGGMLLLMTSTAHGQGYEDTCYLGVFEEPSREYFGPSFGIEMVSADSQIITSSTPDICNCDITGVGVGFYGGLSFQYLLGEDPKNSNMSLLFNVGYRLTPLTFEKEIDNIVYLSEMIENADQLNDNVLYSQELEIGMVNGSATFVFFPIENNGLTLEAGFDIGLLLTKNVRDEMSINDENGLIKFKDGLDVVEYEDDKRIVLNDEEIENANAISVGLIAGISYEIFTGRSWFLVPSIKYNYQLTNISTESDTRISSIQVGIAVRWAF
jgi:hypothetical protein